MKPAAVIWDMDGTLFDSSTVVPDAFIAALSAAGAGDVLPQQVIDAYGLGPPSILLGHFLARPATDEDIDRYHRELELAASEVTVYAGIPEILHLMKRRLGLAVFTGASGRAADILLRATGLVRYFDAIVGGDEIANPKPAPDGILEACRRLGVSTSRAAYVGDAAVDLEAARRAGVHAIAAGWGHMYLPGAAQADAVAASPLDLPAAVGMGPPEERSPWRPRTDSNRRRQP
jgi:HAD superfamily hydrolase (TIGR01509 family)